MLLTKDKIPLIADQGAVGNITEEETDDEKINALVLLVLHILDSTSGKLDLRRGRR